MNYYVKIKLYLLANFLAYPFLKFRGYCLGLESIAMEYITLMKKVCVQGSFNHSFDNTYVLYSLYNGVFFKEDKYNEGVLSVSKNVTKDGTMDVSSRMALKDVKAFQRFCSDVEHNHCVTRERWTLHYKNKQINSIVCQLNIIPDYLNHRNKKVNMDALAVGIVFDHNFNVVSIIKQNLLEVKSKYADVTYHQAPVSTVIVDGEISLDDEFLLINLAIAEDNAPLIEMFPEYYQHTVYDYSSDEFKQRLELYKMVNY